MAEDRRRARHAATKQDIVAAAWRLAHERGLGGWSLRDVAEAVGMRAPSL
jgi:AcrR family transcriptional regulator